MDDNYTHVEKGVYYIVESILGPVESSVDYEHLSVDFNSKLIQHCECDTCSSILTCKCLQISGGNNYVPYTAENRKHILNNNKESCYPLVECNDYCTCLEDCGNRTVQKGPLENLVIRTCDEKTKGFGLYSSTFIPKGTYICEYAGELITKSEAYRRHDKNKKYGKMNYIFCLNESCGDKVVQMFVDPSEFGNIGRYINHSCEPNCRVFAVRCQTPIPKLAIFSHVDIPPHSEITFHYGSNNNKPMGNNSGIRCLCNSSLCTSFMPNDIYL